MHPSDVANKMKEYYGKQNVAVYCEDFSKYIDFNGDGVIDDKDGEYLDIVPDQVTYEENFIATEGQVRNIVSGMYASLAEFIQYQKVLECARLGMGSNDVNPSSPYDRTLNSAWSAAYKTIHHANLLVNGLGQADSDWATYYYAEALAVRSFAYYQLAMLWGNVPVVVVKGTFDYTQQPQDYVLSFVLNDLQTAKDLFDSHDPWGRPDQHFNSYNVRVLLAEVFLTLQQRNNALQYLPTTDYYDYCLFVGNDIYSYESLELLVKEANGNTEELPSGWMNGSYKYGAWAALKRLGVAQEVASCNDYELLLPIPEPELAANANIRQNPGY